MDLRFLAVALVLSYMANIIVNFVVASKYLYNNEVNLFVALIPAMVSLVGCVSLGYVFKETVAIQNQWLAVLANRSIGVIGAALSLGVTGQWRKLEILSSIYSKIDSKLR